MAKKNSPMRRWRRAFKKVAKNGTSFAEAREKADKMTGYNIGSRLAMVEQIVEALDGVAAKLAEAREAKQEESVSD